MLDIDIPLRIVRPIVWIYKNSSTLIVQPYDIDIDSVDIYPRG